MPSTPAGDRKQLSLPRAPILDRWGLHAEDCECARCALGFRPSRDERWRSRQAAEAAEARRKKVADAAAQQTKEDEKRAVTWVRLGIAERDTAEMLKRLTAPVERPATDAELDELKRAYGFKTRRRERP